VLGVNTGRDAVLVTVVDPSQPLFFLGVKQGDTDQPKAANDIEKNKLNIENNLFLENFIDLGLLLVFSSRFMSCSWLF